MFMGDSSENRIRRAAARRRSGSQPAGGRKGGLVRARSGQRGVAEVGEADQGNGQTAGVVRASIGGSMQPQAHWPSSQHDAGADESVWAESGAVAASCPWCMPAWSACAIAGPGGTAACPCACP
jgi:hypothetical protein